jgi:hypothetical protein|tara:strand:+ start:482 stop:832 length:351 start_codon:yes stop_codon:yes gene_type:complete
MCTFGFAHRTYGTGDCRMEHFDYPDVDVTDDGLPILMKHRCGRCGYTCEPEDQSLWTNDDGNPIGMIAISPCLDCKSSIVSAMGHPEFMLWAIPEIDSIYSPNNINSDVSPLRSIK